MSRTRYQAAPSRHKLVSGRQSTVLRVFQADMKRDVRHISARGRVDERESQILNPLGRKVRGDLEERAGIRRRGDVGKRPERRLVPNLPEVKRPIHQHAVNAVRVRGRGRRLEREAHVVILRNGQNQRIVRAREGRSDAVSQADDVRYPGHNQNIRCGGIDDRAGRD